VLRRVEAPLKDGLDRRVVAAHKGVRIEPESGKRGTLEDAVGCGSEWFVPPVVIHEPVDLTIRDAPDAVFPHAVTAIGTELLPQIIANAAGGDLGD
jgi:hypothetical protein